MKLFSLEELAERWTLGHTVALAAWVVVVILGLALLFKGDPKTYPVVQERKVYAAENATFTYPANWRLNTCESGRSFIELPGTIRSDYKRRKNYQLSMYGADAFNCLQGRPERFDLYSENIPASATPCSIATSTRGERLKNGLYLQLQEQGARVLAVHIVQNRCFAPANTVVLGFAFSDPHPEGNDAEEFGMPTVIKEDFVASPQYKDIRELAESIKY